MLAELTRSQWEHLIDEHVFSERDRKIMKRKLLDGVPFEALAEEVDMSTRQVKNIVKKHKENLIKYV